MKKKEKERKEICLLQSKEKEIFFFKKKKTLKLFELYFEVENKRVQNLQDLNCLSN